MSKSESKRIDIQGGSKERIAELERKLAEQQANFRFMCEWLAGTKLPPSKGEEELNTLLAKAKEEGRRWAMEDGKIPKRFSWLIEQLMLRFPNDISKFSSKPPELCAIEAIDAMLASAPKP